MGYQDLSRTIAHDSLLPAGMLVEKSRRKSQKVAKSFGGFRKYAYICSDKNEHTQKFTIMKDFQLFYKTNTFGATIGCDTIEEGKAIIDKLTKNATRTDSKFNSVEFFISDFYTDEIVYTSPRFITATVDDINKL